jgi:hypothetical protein
MGNFLEDALMLLRGEQFKEQPRGFLSSPERYILSREVDSTAWWVVATVVAEPEASQGVVELELQLDPGGVEYGTEYRFQKLDVLRAKMRGVIAELEARAASGKNLQCPRCGQWMRRRKSQPGRPYFTPFLGCEGYPDCQWKIREGVVEIG